MKTPIFVIPLILAASLLSGGIAMPQRQMENLNRGVVAVKKSTTQIYGSWRLFGNDPTGVAFNLYRSANSGAATKLNTSPLTTTTYSYFVRPVIGGVEMAGSETSTVTATTSGSKQYQSVPLRADTGPNGPYDVKFCWAGDTDNVTVYDMDGDGRAEVLVRTADGVSVTNAVDPSPDIPRLRRPHRSMRTTCGLRKVSGGTATSRASSSTARVQER